MKEITTKLIKKHGTKLCDVAVAAASITRDSCRGNWYQPEEPKGIKDFYDKRKTH